MATKIKLSEWAARRYSPPPSLFTLRKWARDGEIQPAPEKAGKHYYVLENAERVGVPMALPAKPRSGAAVDESPHRLPEDWWTRLVFGRSQVSSACRDFYNPAKVTCGVYLVLDEAKKEVVYVGSSVQLQNRLRNGTHIPSHFPTFAFEADEGVIRNVEAAYYEALRPRMNRKCPPGIAIPEMVAAIKRSWGTKA